MAIQDDILAYLHRNFDPAATVYSGSAEVLPPHWQDYVSDDEAVRRFALRAELNSIAPYLPRLAAGLESVSIDAFLVESPYHGICRIIVRQMNGELYPAYSRLPVKFQEEPAKIWNQMDARGPQALSWIYRVKMDGLTDIGGFAGFKSTKLLTTMAAEIDTYGEQPWYGSFAESTDTGSVVELLASGGGGYLLVDLNVDASSERNPNALFVYLDEGTEPEAVLLFQYLDNWMEIGLVEVEN